MDYFYYGTTKTYIIAFSKLLSDIYIKRKDNANNEIKSIKVPIVYASKSKISYSLQRNEKLEENISIVLPSIGFNITSIDYDSTRKLNSVNQIHLNDLNYMYEGVPYNYTFTVSIKTKYQEDLYQILEQLLVRFRPDTSLSVNEIPFENMERDVPIILQSVTPTNENEMDEETTRHFNYDLTFLLKGHLYPIVNDYKYIYKVDSNLRNYNTGSINAIISHLFNDPDTTTEIKEF